MAPFAETGKWVTPLLDCVHITRETDGSAIFTTTDKYCLARYRVAESGLPDSWPEDGVNIPAKDLGVAVKMFPIDRYTVNTVTIVHEPDQNRVMFTTNTGQVTTAPTTEGNYPNVGRIVKDHVPGTDATNLRLNPVFMEKFGKVATSNQTMLLVPGATPQKPVLVLIGDAFVGMIVPLKNDGQPLPTPEWATT
ncbi:MAG: hypothetical protein M0R06_15540 [Sphaerochaeta sp.]|nr:hypothetical protein [Sphaerochaeta sp.]